jgi:hypothetical protein
MARVASLTHDLVVVQKGDGEPEEDAMERSVAEGGWLDEEISESFPASDPLSHWAGPARPTSEADRARRQVVHRHGVEDAPEREDPESPVPGTIRQQPPPR